MRSPTTAGGLRPFHEAMCRWARRAQHDWQVFGLAGTHLVVLLVAVASQSDDQCR